MIKDPLFIEERHNGRDLVDKALFEVNIQSGSIEWVNDYVIDKLGYSFNQLITKSLFDLIPYDLQDKIKRNIINSSKSRQYFIFPVVTFTGEISWWYIFESKTDQNRKWIYAEHLQNTSYSGPEYSFMCFQMKKLDDQIDLEAKIDDFEIWVKNQIDRIDLDVEKVRESVSNLSLKVDASIISAKNAASNSLDAKNASLAVQREFQIYFEMAQKQQNDSMTEIIKLMK